MRNKKYRILLVLFLPAWLIKISVGDKVEITKKSGKVLQGSFIGVFRHDPFKYYNLYKKFKDSNPGMITPDINDTVIVVTDHNERLKGTFLGTVY